MLAVALRVFRARWRLVRLFLVLRAGTAGAGLHPRAGGGAGVGAVAGWRRVLRALELRSRWRVPGDTRRHLARASFFCSAGLAGQSL
ncbi:hypothetical protein C8J57DRAFT_1393196, partial [Mycena rebaudengoi]